MHGAIAGILAIAVGAPGYAGAISGRTVGCAAQGYTMQVPETPGWAVQQNCSPFTTIIGPHRQVTLNVAVEVHGWWSDGRSRSSIANDIVTLDTGYVAVQLVTFHSMIIAGQAFFEGNAAYRHPDGTNWLEIEMETFAAGRMYKFSAHIKMVDSKTDAANGKIIGAIWHSIRIRGTPSHPAPQQGIRPSTNTHVVFKLNGGGAGLSKIESATFMLSGGFTVTSTEANSTKTHAGMLNVTVQTVQGHTLDSAIVDFPIPAGAKNHGTALLRHIDCRGGCYLTVNSKDVTWTVRVLQ